MAWLKYLQIVFARGINLWMIKCRVIQYCTGRQEVGVIVQQQLEWGDQGGWSGAALSKESIEGERGLMTGERERERAWEA